MSSANRHKANRQNAQRSSGPRTDEDKRRSSSTPCGMDAAPAIARRQCLAAEGLHKPRPRARAVAILNYERNVQYLRERYMQSKQHGHVQAKPTRKSKFCSYGNIA